MPAQFIAFQSIDHPGQQKERKLIYTAIAFARFGAISLAHAATQPTHADALGFLIEPFGLIAGERVLLLVSAGLAIIAVACWAMRRAAPSH